jgi:predicted alpha/beta hydrolase
VRMRDWCILDVPGVLAWAAREHPGRPIHWVGHSMGGFATGLAGAAKIGHHGFFRDQFRDTLWPKAVEWLEGEPAS